MSNIGNTVTSSPVFVMNVDESYINKSIKLILHGKMKNNDPAPRDLLQTAEWSVADPTVCKIEGSFLVPLKKGETNVYATINGIKATAKVVVQDNLVTERLIISHPNVTIPVGGVVGLGSEVRSLSISISSTDLANGGIININR